MKKAVCLAMVLISGGAAAQNMPESAFYIGLGGALNSTAYHNQNITAVGTSNVYDNNSGSLISSGSAGGPAVNVNLDSTTDMAPVVQAGFFKRIQGTEYLWGAKLGYSYNNASSASQAFLVPQYGAFGTTPFTGNAVIRSYKSELKQQFNLLPYFGKSFQNSSLYLGAGPTLSQVKTSASGVIGFADINGQRTDISGAPQSFTNDNWVWGWQASVGGTYFIDKAWFLDVNYLYGRTGNYTADLSGPFTNVAATRTYEGNLIGSASGYITTNSLMVSINKAF